MKYRAPEMENIWETQNPQMDYRIDNRSPETDISVEHGPPEVESCADNQINESVCLKRPCNLEPKIQHPWGLRKDPATMRQSTARKPPSSKVVYGIKSSVMPRTYCQFKVLWH